MASKFKGILDHAKGRTAEAPETPEEEPSAAAPVVAPPPSPAPAAEPQAKKRGRPSGKRSDPDCVQVTAYINKHRHQAAKMELLKDGGSQDFSELVDSLLAEWLKSRT